MVFVDPIDRYAKGEKWCGMAAGFGRIFGWHCIFIAFGYGNTAFTSEKYRAGGNISKKGTYIQNNDDAICGNIPEGMSVGVAYAGAALQGSGISTAAAFALAIGIAIQNFPEGAIISLPLCAEGMSRKRAFICGMLSGIVEPIGGFITILIAGLITPILPYLLSFAAGAMIYVVIDELIPESQAGEHSNIGTIGAAVGFALMMVLDVALG